MLPKLFKHIYLPDIEIFHYKKTKAQVLSKLQEVFEQRPGMWSGPDISGRILSDSQFCLKMSAPKYGSDRMNPIMYCIIHEGLDGKCTIETKAYAGLRLKVNLYLFFILGCILILIGCVHDSYEVAIFGFVIMALAAIIVNWIAYIVKGVIQDRYFRYIHSQLG